MSTLYLQTIDEIRDRCEAACSLPADAVLVTGIGAREREQRPNINVIANEIFPTKSNCDWQWNGGAQLQIYGDRLVVDALVGLILPALSPQPNAYPGSAKVTVKGVKSSSVTVDNSVWLNTITLDISFVTKAYSLTLPA